MQPCILCNHIRVKVILDSMELCGVQRMLHTLVKGDRRGVPRGVIGVVFSVHQGIFMTSLLI